MDTVQDVSHIWSWVIIKEGRTYKRKSTLFSIKLTRLSHCELCCRPWDWQLWNVEFKTNCTYLPWPCPRCWNWKRFWWKWPWLVCNWPGGCFWCWSLCWEEPFLVFCTPALWPNSGPLSPCLCLYWEPWSYPETVLLERGSKFCLPSLSLYCGNFFWNVMGPFCRLSWWKGFPWMPPDLESWSAVSKFSAFPSFWLHEYFPWQNWL